MGFSIAMLVYQRVSGLFVKILSPSLGKCPSGSFDRIRWRKHGMKQPRPGQVFQDVKRLEVEEVAGVQLRLYRICIYIYHIYIYIIYHFDSYNKMCCILSQCYIDYIDSIDSIFCAFYILHIQLILYTYTNINWILHMSISFHYSHTFYSWYLFTTLRTHLECI